MYIAWVIKSFYLRAFRHIPPASKGEAGCALKQSWNALLLGHYMLTFRRRLRAGTYPPRLTVAATCLTGASVE